MNRIYIKLMTLGLPLILVSCGAKKNLVKDTPVVQKTVSKSDKAADEVELKKLSFVQKVSDNSVYATNIVGDLRFNIKAGGRDITVPGSLHMRKNQVIRIQLFIPLLGSEVGRLEFTPDYVLVIDRIHKEYVKADYTQLDFLKDNGLNFYSLQSLFWNQLFLPGTDKVSETALRNFSVKLDDIGENNPVSWKNNNMSFVWNANKQSGLISETDVAYRSLQHGMSTLNWKYSNFTNVGVKMFPAKQNFKFTTTATKQKQTAEVTLDMEEVATKDNWDVNTTISNKYKKIEAADILGKIMSL
ncbi:DUF4292 domain-containing protein [Prevotella sp.]|uniref:DUF4292 domain-containing protein n=1 Tax=Prevotella sp. TaxID=59823 RepID=UPI003DA3C6C0